MAFAELFSRLSALEEPAGPALTHRHQAGSGGRGRGWKRRAQAEQTGPERKKRFHQAQTAKAYDAPSRKDGGSEARRYQMPCIDGERASLGLGVTQNHGNEAGYSRMCHRDQNHRAKANLEKKTKGRKVQHQQKDGGRPANGRGGYQTRAMSRRRWENENKNVAKAAEVICPRSMTHEFRDQNALLVDGRFVCRHFLWGRCIKGDDCQLDHIQGCNDVIKEVCKFYVQGWCTKGESCPYMHKSFPCKFFHRKGKCTQGVDCKFSHEPLNGITTKLLEEALKRENEIHELAKKAEQESLGQPANTEESEMAEANRAPDILSEPLRPNFYKSADTDAEKVTLSSQTEELAEANPAHASDGDQPRSPPSTNLDRKEPVCYSVEAVLGPQLSKPFPSFCATPSAPLSSSNCTADSADQKEAPYSVSAVLRSCKSVECFPFDHTPAAHTVSYTPKTSFEGTTGTQTDKILHSVNTRNEANKSQEKLFKSLASLQVHSRLISKTSPDLCLASGDERRHGGNMPKSMTLVQTASHQAKLDLSQSPVTVAEKSASSAVKGGPRGNSHLPADNTFTVNFKSATVLPNGPALLKNIFSTPPGQMLASKQLKPHISVLMPVSQASVKAFSYSSGFTEAKGRAALPVEPVTISCKGDDSTNSLSGLFAAKPTEHHPHSEKTPADLEVGTLQRHSTENTAERSCEVAHCDELAVGCKKTQKRSLGSFFSSPATDTLQSTDSPVTGSSCPQSLGQSSCPAPQSADCRTNHPKIAAQPDKPSANSFLSLFAAPLRANPLPHMQSQPGHLRTSTLSEQSKQSSDHASDLSDSKQRTSSLETPRQHQITEAVSEMLNVPRSPNFSLNPKVGNEDCSLQHINQPMSESLVDPVCSLLSDSVSAMSSSTAPRGNGPSAAHNHHQQESDISSHKGSALVATENSVLRTLFVSLSPFQQDGEQQDCIQTSVPSESGKDKSSTECVFVQQKSKKKGVTTIERRKKKLKSTEKTAECSAEHQPSPHTPQVSFKATGGPILSPGMTEAQVKNPGTHSSPVKPTQHHTRSRSKQTSEEGKCGDGNVAPTPLKDLFKKLDTTVDFGC